MRRRTHKSRNSVLEAIKLVQGSMRAACNSLRGTTASKSLFSNFKDVNSPTQATKIGLSSRRANRNYKSLTDRKNAQKLALTSKKALRKTQTHTRISSFTPNPKPRGIVWTRRELARVNKIFDAMGSPLDLFLRIKAKYKKAKDPHPNLVDLNRNDMSVAQQKGPLQRSASGGSLFKFNQTESKKHLECRNLPNTTKSNLPVPLKYLYVEVLSPRIGFSLSYHEKQLLKRAKYPTTLNLET